MSKSSREQKVHQPEIEGREKHDDELIVAPKGKSKTRFLLTLLLLIMILTTFSVSQELVAVFTGKGGKGSAFLVWTHPTEGTKSLSDAEFILEKQMEAKVFAILVGRRERENADEETARTIVIGDIAENAGVHVPDTEIRTFIEKRFAPGSYRQILSANRITPPEFESTLRKMLEVDRYQTLISAPIATPKPSTVEALWKARHQEYAFEYIELPTEGLRAEAQAGLPSDSELEAWFNALPPQKVESYKRQLAVAAELAVLPLDGQHSTDRLFAKYPRPADEDAEAAAKEYYDGYTFVRFRNKNLPTDRQPTQEDFFLPYEDVKDTAKREAVIYRSLGDWRTALVARADAGENIDFAAEATELGLVPYSQSNPLTQTEWAALDLPWMSKNLSEYLTGMPEAGKFFPAVSVDEKSLAVGRTLAKEDPRMPGFEELKPKLTEEWLKQRMGELAISKLTDVRSKLGTPPDASDPAAADWTPEVDREKFSSVAADAGFQVQVRDYMERPKTPADSPAQAYLRASGQLYSSKVNSVPKPEVARDGKNAYLVRIAGLRDADASTMTPGEFQSLSDQAVREAITEFKTRTFLSKDFLKERFAVQLKSWDKPPKQN